VSTSTSRTSFFTQSDITDSLDQRTITHFADSNASSITWSNVFPGGMILSTRPNTHAAQLFCDNFCSWSVFAFVTKKDIAHFIPPFKNIEMLFVYHKAHPLLGQHVLMMILMIEISFPSFILHRGSRGGGTLRPSRAQMNHTPWNNTFTTLASEILIMKIMAWLNEKSLQVPNLSQQESRG